MKTYLMTMLHFLQQVSKYIYNYIIIEYNKIRILHLGFISNLDIVEETATILIYWQNFMHPNIKKTVPFVNMFDIQ